ncbi:methyltransferase domain-containing protein [candidate division KSB1 bacterium]
MERTSKRENWDKFWDRDRKVEDIYPASDSIIENLAAVTEIKGKRILEVGGGTGRDSIKLSSMGADVFILDYSDNALYKVREAAAFSEGSVELIRGDAMQTPLRSGSFDIVFHQGLIEHFRDPVPLLKDNVRILKEGGLLLIDVPQKYHIYTLIKHILILINKWFAGWETEFTIRELRKFYKDHNLTIDREYGDYMVPSLFYRVIRELLKAAGIKLAMYPGKVPVLNSIRKSFKRSLQKRRFMLNTYLTIGVIGKKE